MWGTAVFASQGGLLPATDLRRLCGRVDQGRMDSVSKKKKSPFPELIHVVAVDDGEGGTMLLTYDDGVQSIDESDKDVAIYKRVKVGTVAIKKTFVDADSV